MTVESFLERFLQPAQGSTPADIAARIRHWIDVANRPQQYIEDASPYALAARRKTAKQNLRKLVGRYPAVAEQIFREVQQ